MPRLPGSGRKKLGFNKRVKASMKLHPDIAKKLLELGMGNIAAGVEIVTNYFIEHSKFFKRDE
jgi:hypothetical protein